MIDSNELTPEEAARRRDEVVKRMLATPPKPVTPKKGTVPKDGPQDKLA